jgi:predicted secreted protein
MGQPASGYKPGSDLLIFVGGKAIGHCSTCTITHGSESQERAVKPLASVTAANAGKWTEKNVSKLTVSITAEGFSFFGETEGGYEKLLELWQAAAPVACKYAYRGEEATKYYGGNFVITNLSETAPAGDDATYSVSLENSGPVTPVDLSEL